MVYPTPPAKRSKSTGAKDEADSDDALFVEIFLDRHDTFLREAQIEIQSLRQRALRLKQWREEMESLLENGLAERSASYPQFFRKP